MVDVAWKQEQRTVQGQAPGELCLRIVGTHRAGQTLRLSAAKCTIGSAEGCTLRLRAAGVRPLHCLILRGLRGTIARSYAAGTLLNGQRFDDARLAVGDRIQIGPIELEVLASDASSAVRESTAASETNVHNEPLPAGPSADRRDESRSEQARLARGRAKKLIELARSLRTQVARLQGQAERAAQLELECRRLGDEHQRLSAAFDQQRQDLDASRLQTEAELQAREDQCQREGSDLTQLRQRLGHEREDLEHERARLQRDFEMRSGALEQERQAWAACKHEDETRLAGQRSQLDTQRGELNREREQLEAERQAAQGELKQSAEQMAAAGRDLQTARENIERQAAAVAKLTTECDEREANFESRERELRSVEAKLAEAHAAIEAHEAELAKARGELAASQAELEAGLEKLQLEREGARRERTAQETQLAQRALDLERMTNDLETRRAELEAEHEAMQRQQQEAAEALRQRAAELESRQTSGIDQQEAELAAARREVEMQQQKLSEAADRFSQQLAELEQLRLELAKEQAAFQEERATWDEQRQARARSSEAIDSSTQAADETDQLTPEEYERLGDEAEWPQSKRRRRRASDVAPPEEKDDSIEEYMAALLNRVRGSEPVVGAPSSLPRRNKRKSDAPPSKKERSEIRPAAAERPPVPVVDMVAGSVELTRRAPVNVEDRAAMREVANAQANLAIDLHARKRLIRTAMVTCSAAVGCLLATQLVLWVVAPHHTGFRTLAMAGFVGAVFWLFTAATAIQQLLSFKRSNEAGLRDNIERAERAKSE
jgi:hypothetical protein